MAMNEPSRHYCSSHPTESTNPSTGKVVSPPLQTGLNPNGTQKRFLHFCECQVAFKCNLLGCGNAVNMLQHAVLTTTPNLPMRCWALPQSTWTLPGKQEKRSTPNLPRGKKETPFVDPKQNLIERNRIQRPEPMLKLTGRQRMRLLK